MGTMADAAAAVGETVRELREAYEGGRTRSLAWRQAQLRGLLRMLKEKEVEAFQALHVDLGKHRAEAYRDEVGVLTKSANGALQQLGRWMAPERVKAMKDASSIQLAIPLTLEALTPVYRLRRMQVWVPLIAWPATAQVVPEPLGVVLIFSCWNFPLGLSLEPLIGAIAAGNAVALKPSELSPCTARFLADNIGKYMDASAVKVVEGGPDVGEQLMEQRWDKVLFTGKPHHPQPKHSPPSISCRAKREPISFTCVCFYVCLTTGSPRIARSVMAAASRHLTPVALELGGKCPCIFEPMGNARELQISVNRIIAGKWSSCAGQACIAIDYVLVEERFAPILVHLHSSCLINMHVNHIHGFTRGYCIYISDMPFFVPVHAYAFARSEDQDAQGDAEEVLPGNGYIEPTILLNPPLDSAIMTEEIFGPLLPIITVKKIEDSIDIIKAMPKPLAIYAFTRDATLRRRIVDETSSGSVTFNDAIVQYAIDGLPFGGVGQSGFGQYHGKYSFDMFSHKKAVMKRGFLIELRLRYPPWEESNVTLMRYLYRFNYVAFVFYFLLLGLKR
ncbi:hypothetical protein HU200_032692 [Digitaria exilis]|uniref:Aldehyde dehydrogenase domain-containing protein n=1 Tax=Digitaria exilis TaxID=1010633 RepID=A0A835BKR2_9POAL|nr:hypothetical protein HU200_032692 [Digitaria exilis]